MGWDSTCLVGSIVMRKKPRLSSGAASERMWGPGEAPTVDDVIARLARLRAMRARMARAEQTRLEQEAQALDAEVDDWSDRLQEAANHPGERGSDAVGAGLFVLHGELERRRVAVKATAGHARADEHAEHVRELETAQKIAERLAERRAEARVAEQRRREQAELDELARLGWWREENS